MNHVPQDVRRVLQVIGARAEWQRGAKPIVLPQLPAPKPDEQVKRFAMMAIKESRKLRAVLRIIDELRRQNASLGYSDGKLRWYKIDISKPGPSAEMKRELGLHYDSLCEYFKAKRNLTRE